MSRQVTGLHSRARPFRHGSSGVSHALRDWRLIEAGPAALPFLIAAFEATQNCDVKVLLIHVMSEYRSTEAIPFFAALLRYPDDEIWKAALDSLVSVGGQPALDVLVAGRQNASAQKREWIDEAVGQLKGTRNSI